MLLISILAAAGTAQAYSISGTVTNTTSTAGRVYLSLDHQGGGSTNLGVSVNVAANSSAPFSIRGVFYPGNYVIKAFLDTAGNGIRYANSPAGSSGNISLGSSNVPGIDFSVSSPVPVGLTGKIPDPAIAAISNIAAINFDSGQMMADEAFIPEFLHVYWGYASDNLVNMNNVAVDGRGDVLILTGLSGVTLYVKLVPVVSGIEDTTHASNIVSAPLLTPTGNSTLIGKVISTGIAKSSATPLFLAAVSDTGGFYINGVSNPSDTQDYTITGVPAGTYNIYAILDMNGNNVIDIGDIQNSDKETPTITADGTSSLTVPDVILTAQNSDVRSGTIHMRTDGGDSYALTLSIRDQTKLVVNGAITGGTQLSSYVPIDIARGDWSEMSFFSGVPARPSIGDLYRVHIEYSDNTSEDLDLPVTAVLDNFALPIYPSGNTAPDSLNPLFSWRAATRTPGYYGYKIWVQNADYTNAWYKDNSMPANQISVSYNNDGNASLNQLVSGSTYTWTIAVRDFFGNEAFYQTSFTPQSSGPSVTGFNPETGTGKITNPPTDGTTVVITGSGFVPESTNVYFGNVQVQSGDFTVDSPTQITARVPSGAPVGPIIVKVYGISASSADIFAPTVNFTGLVKDISGGNLSSVTVSTNGLAPFYPEGSTATDGSGLYSATVPAAVPFSLRFSKAAFHDVYTAQIAGAQNNASPSEYVLFTDADLSGMGINLNPGKGLIATRVANADNTGNSVSGATGIAISKIHGPNYYTVAYSNPSNPAGAVVSGPGTSTHSDGMFYVLNVDDGDYVEVRASLAGWGFRQMTFITHDGAVSETLVGGTPLPVVTPNPAPDTYPNAQSVALTAGNETACASGCAIFYTTNGNDPTLPGALSYTGSSILINNTTTLKFYAKNGDGFSGNVVAATYVIAGLPTVTTAAISNITSTTASGGGDITSDGESAIMARGVCWSTSPSPSLVDSCTNEGTSTGIFSSSIAGLAAGQLYHVRAYATNVVGTAYGADVPFTTGNTKGDFSGDGKPDILWRNAATGDNYVWYLDGVTVLGGGNLPTVADLIWQVVGIEDFNNDGKSDVLWRNTATGDNYVWYLDGVTVLGGGNLPTVADQNWKVVGVEDFNNDNKPDILWRYETTGDNYVWYLDGVTVLGGGNLPAVADQNWKVVGVADFNNDGNPDILWRYAATGENYVWYLDGATVLGGGNLPMVAEQNWNIVGVGDYNNDGKPDVLWRNTGTGDNYVWYMNGVTVLGGGNLPTVADQNWTIVP